MEEKKKLRCPLGVPGGGDRRANGRRPVAGRSRGVGQSGSAGSAEGRAGQAKVFRGFVGRGSCRGVGRFRAHR